MKNYLLPCVLVLWLITPFFVSGDDWWWQWHQVSSNKWIKEAWCESVINSSSCDYTWPSVVLRYGYEYQFNDEFWAWNQDRRMKNFCYQFKEQSNFWDYNQWANPSFGWTSQLANNGYWVYKNTSLRVLSADKMYQIKAVPDRRSQDNLFIKYVIEYANDEAAKTRYHHTECFPYEISRCGDGVVDTDWFKKDPTDPAEKCDPADPNKTGWGNGGCSRTCEPITVAAPVCNSTYNGQRLVSLVSGDYLCEKWTISDFAYSDSTHKWTWKCNNTAWEWVDCSATKPYCGDGIKDAGETCDPQDPNREWFGNGGCDNSCNPITVAWPACNSDYNGKRVDSLSESSKLCNEWTATWFNYDSTNHKWTWKCGNTLWTTVDCSATKPYCGDGIKDTWEQCDDGEKNGTAASSCSSTCTTVSSVSCGTKDKWRTYFFNKQTTPWLTTTSTGMCDSGLTVWTPTIVWTDSHLEWTCSNTNWSSTTCTAYQEYCGDGIVQWSEECDGGDFCTSQCKTVTPSEACDQTFTSALRLNETKTFIDTFNAGWLDRYLFDKEVIFKENHWDYNNGNDPTFSRTSQLVSNWMKVGANSSMPAIQSTPYHVLSAPSKRAWDNLYIEYTIWYDNVDHATSPSRSNLYSHKECVYYEISRCGDGVLDTNYGEICDPKDPNKTGWGNGGCDNSCKPITVVENPLCNSEYNWKTVSNLTEQDNLCTRWTVTNFKYDSTTYKWTWTCDNSAWSVDCSANKKQTPKWEYKIEKTLIWSKEIKNTWDAVVWNIKVTAINWDVNDFIITDKMPSILWYSGYMVIRDSWMTISQPTLSWNEIIWEATWTLKQWDYVEIQLTTYAKEMPDHDYKNVACVKWTNPTDPEKCDDEDLPSPKVRIKKSFTDLSKTKTVTIGDELAYRITFGNSGNASATITSIKDFLPKNVKYVSSEIFLNGQSVHTNTTQDGVYIDIFTGMTLQPGDTWYIIMTGKVLNENLDSRTNFVCIYLNDNKIECDDARHDITTWVMCMPPEIENKSFVNAGSTKVTCKTSPTGEKADISLDCGNGTIFTWSNISELTETCTYSSRWTYTVQCKVNGEDMNNCKWTVSVTWGGSGWDDPHCKAPEVVNSWDYIKNVTCKTDNGEDYLIGISCHSWDSIHVSSWRVSSFTYTCEYDKAGDYDIQCYVPKTKSATTVTKDDTKPTQCGIKSSVARLCKSVTVDPASSTSAARKVTCETTLPANEVNSIELYCDYANNKTNPVKTGSKVSSITGECSYSSNGTYQVQCVVNWKVEDSCKATAEKKGGWGWWSSGWWGGWWGKCKLEDGSRSSNPLCQFANPHCFNVNEWNVSIEKWELLPLYFNIFKDKTQIDDYNFIVYSASKYPLWKTSSYDWILNDTSKCTPWDIALNSLKCTYEILDGKNNVVYEKQIACLDDGSNYKQWGLVGAWFRRQKDVYGALQSVNDGNGYTFTTNVELARPSEWREFNWNDLYYWEYKLQITKVEYLQCDESGRRQPDDVTAVCQSNFTLTNSYTVQKTPSGNFTNTSTDKLRNYLYANGKSTMDWLLTSIAGTSEYSPNAKVKSAMDNFIKKYEKLAVKVNTVKFWNKVEVRKVPWKNIYFLSGEAEFKESSSDTKPFTIVQTKWSVTINWNVQHNMMLLTNWNITFKWSCTSNQTVKWIFYAWGSLNREWVWKNDKETNTVWCDKWWLTVKWVLIWNGLNDLMKNSRSNLTNWWTNKTAQTVMNWASVLIEYSPSIFTKSTMPPGAEDFTTALSVYKN